MVETVRNFAIDWQDWASTQDLSYNELNLWKIAFEHLADIADETGKLKQEFKENGVI